MKKLLSLLLLPVLAAALVIGVAASSRDDSPSATHDDNDGHDHAAIATSAAASDAAALAASQSASPATLQEITVTADETGETYNFYLTRTALKTGKVQLTLINKGPDRPHNFVVKTLDGDTDLAATLRVEPGNQETVEFELTQSGTYNFLCSLRGHADRGQRGSFTVTQ